MRMRIRHVVRQDPAIPSISGFSGVISESSTVPAPTDGLVLNSSAPLNTDITAPPIASSFTPTITLPVSTSSSPPAATSVAAASSSNDSSIPVGTVVGACVGAFAGLGLLICLLLWGCKRTNQSKSRDLNAARRAEQEHARDLAWNRLDADEKAVPLPPPSPNQQESDEKNFSMFKKSPSVRTAKTHTSEGDHVSELPPLNFTTYHPGLAAELASEQPHAHPFVVAAREDSGVSWGGTTVNDDSFLSMRSVRVDSGTMSPTMVVAKMTPPATSSPIHRWESAEVLHAEEIEAKNPFTDAHDERRAGGGNPFFNANDMNRLSRVGHSRSRSNSRTSRAQSMSRDAGELAYMPSQNPFLDAEDAVPTTLVEPPAEYTSSRPDLSSVASGASAHAFATPRAMRSLIAALELTQEEVEERLRVVSMQPSIVSGISSISGLDDESDIGEVREFPLPPSNTSAPH